MRHLRPRSHEDFPVDQLGERALGELHEVLDRLSRSGLEIGHRPHSTLGAHSARDEQRRRRAAKAASKSLDYGGMKGRVILDRFALPSVTSAFRRESLAPYRS